jgi:hypothetical protein
MSGEQKVRNAMNSDAPLIDQRVCPNFFRDLHELFATQPQKVSYVDRARADECGFMIKRLALVTHGCL